MAFLMPSESLNSQAAVLIEPENTSGAFSPNILRLKVAANLEETQTRATQKITYNNVC